MEYGSDTKGLRDFLIGIIMFILSALAFIGNITPVEDINIHNMIWCCLLFIGMILFWILAWKGLESLIYILLIERQEERGG